MRKFIDLRSDTTTRPTLAMRKAMAEAEVGDDVYDDDPTVHRLQKKAAALLGKEAALFMPSGTMSNAVAIKTHTQAGDEVLMDAEAHSMLYEVGNPATIAHVMTRQFRSDRGIPEPREIVSLFQRETLHAPRTSLLILENTHNRAGGAAIPLEVHQALWHEAHSRQVAVHLDGARLFNAAVALQIPAAAFAACTDSVTFCLSKGLGCPVGSILCGTREFIKRARRVRKMLGGGLRQAGILCASGIFALDHHIERLAEDHENARRLARGIACAPGVVLETAVPATNMIYMRTESPAEVLMERLKARHRVLVGDVGAHRIRLVTHLDVSADDVDRAAAAIMETCRSAVCA